MVVLFILIIIFFAEPYIDFTQTFLIAMSHQIFLVSFGAFTILMYLIKNNSASKTVSIFFLIPATSAFMAWLFLNESLTNLDLIGFANSYTWCLYCNKKLINFKYLYNQTLKHASVIE